MQILPPITSKRAGVYKIENLVNGKFYIGSTIDLSKRKSGHFRDLERRKHPNRHLQGAFDLYGKDSFSFIILLICEHFQVLAYEQEIMDRLLPEYNFRKIAMSNVGLKASEETRKKLSAAHKGKPCNVGKKQSEETKRLRSMKLRGKKKTPEHVANIIKGKTGCKYGPMSDEHKGRISAALAGRRPPNYGKPTSPETKKKISQSMKLFRAKKKENGCN